MSKPFRCRVVTPTAQLLDHEAKYASVPLWDGMMGILPGRAPIVARLGAGELQLDIPDDKHANAAHRSYFVAGGFMQMSADTLTILAEQAIPAEQLSESEAQAELAEAEARQVPADAPDRAAAADKLREQRDAARWKLRIARQAKGRGI